LLKKMLPMLAMMVAGALAKQGDDGGPAPSRGGGLGGMLGGLIGGAGRSEGAGGGLSGLAAMLDQDGDA
jgi:hypothetical protein